MSEQILGIDIGGSGIKGAPVDLATGDLVRERLRIPTAAAPTFWITIVDVVFARPLLIAFLAAYAPYTANAPRAMPFVL